MPRNRRLIRTAPDIDTDAPISEDHGKICEVKDLYQSKPDENGRSSWTVEVPVDILTVAENAETEKYALLIRNEKCYDGRRKFTIHSIVVQSPVLKEILTEIFKDYTGVTINVRRLEFQPPWHCFVHRWTQLVETKNKLVALADQDKDDQEATEKRDHIVLLYNVLKQELRDVVNTRDDLLREGVMSFDLIWTLYEPGSIVISGNEAFQVTSSSNAPDGRHYVASQNIDWNGEKFGSVNCGKYVMPFAGTRPILKLPIYPLACRDDADAVRRRIIARARKFESLCGFNYKQYSGFAEYDTPCGRARHTVNSRIVIDTESWNSFNPNYNVNVGALPMSISTTGITSYEDSEPDSFDMVPTPDVDSQPSKQEHRECRLTDHQLLITSSTLRGYSAKDKRWMYFETENVSDITWDEDAFESLVLPEKHKELVRSVAESQAAFSSYFDDVISGKGQGMILLLMGPPGVGKTLTAESVAEAMKVPLYYLSTIDLGSDAASIESTLSKVFRMVTKWNAVLLLDEADVFLEKRTTHDLERNKLVSGILMLTTNRGDTIDDAFQSRIHLRLTYDALSDKSRYKIWQNFVKGLKYKHQFNDNDFQDLAKRELNGRQIKNLLKTAVLLAARKGESLRKSHIEFVLEIDSQS